MSISELAVIGSKAKIGVRVKIGPFAVIEDGAELGNDVKIASHAHILKGSVIGDECVIHTGAVIGDLPQDLSFDDKLDTFVRIGNRTVVREYATIHRATKEGGATSIGENCYLMAVSHVGHDCHIGNGVIIANGALLAGHVEVGDNSFVSGNVVVHQYCRIGRLAMIGGFTGVNKDVPPFMLVRGPSVVRSVNLVGLRRAKFSREVISDIKEAYRLIYMTDLNTSHALEEIKKYKQSKELEELSSFILGSKRGICKYKYVDGEYFE